MVLWGSWRNRLHRFTHSIFFALTKGEQTLMSLRYTCSARLRSIPRSSRFTRTKFIVEKQLFPTQYLIKTHSICAGMEGESSVNMPRCLVTECKFFCTVELEAAMSGGFINRSTNANVKQRKLTRLTYLEDRMHGFEIINALMRVPWQKAAILEPASWMVSKMRHDHAQHFGLFRIGFTYKSFLVPARILGVWQVWYLSDARCTKHDEFCTKVNSCSRCISFWCVSKTFHFKTLEFPLTENEPSEKNV